MTILSARCSGTRLRAYAIVLFSLTGSLLLLWLSPTAFSAVWSLKVPHRQPTLDIPTDTTTIDVALVIPKTRHDDVRWIASLDYSIFTAFVYTQDVWREPQYLAPRARAGREVSAYLSYILDYYDALPRHSVFVHAGPDQWHNDVFAKVNNQHDTLQYLRTAAIDAHGFVNLRCKEWPGCPIAISPFAPVEKDVQNRLRGADFPELYTQIFNVTRDEVPEQIGNVCCAQFAVSRSRILDRPREDYERMMRWVQETREVDDFGVGWVFEKLWHIVFGKDAVHCPRVEQCRCDNFGWCGPLASGEILTPAGA